MVRVAYRPTVVHFWVLACLAASAQSGLAVLVVLLRFYGIAAYIETASRIRLAFAAACPHAALFRQLATTIVPAGP